LKDVTICVTSCGEIAESKCLESIESFLDQGVVLQRVTNVFPQIKALNQMLQQCNTQWLICLDADIILNNIAFRRIEIAIAEDGVNPKVHSILFSLWDTLTEKNILALKVLRMSIMKQFPFIESATPDVEHFKRLTDAGYICVDRHLSEGVIGNHVIQGPRFCYNKYRDVYQTLRSHGFEWDSGAFMGGETIVEKSRKHFDFFFYKLMLTDNKDYLYCIAGMIDGLTAPIEHKSKSLEKKKFRIKSKNAIDEYFLWYQKQQSHSFF